MVAATYPPLAPRGNYVGGAFRPVPSPDGALRSVNPGDPADVIGEFPWARSAIDEAVGAARAAFPAWRRTQPGVRAEHLRRYGAAVEREKERLSATISREMGKPLWEARTEVAAMIAKVAITLDEGMRLVDEVRPAGLAGVIRHAPRGVLVVIGPFNFPGHLPNGHLVPALATGNTVVFKPADQTPGVGQLVAECIDAAGFPPGVFNLLQLPGSAAGDALVQHRDVDGILFTGSTAVGQRIQELTLRQYWKLPVLEMGGKNAAIVLGDAALDAAVYEVLTGAFLTTGQRCTSTSRVIVERTIADRFVARFLEGARALRAGIQHDPDVFMGPLVHRRAAEEFQAWQATAEAEGHETLLSGGLMASPPVPGGAYVTPSVHRAHRVDPNSTYQTHELFAPDACVYVVDSLEEALAVADGSEYGLACSIFTASREAYLAAVREVRAGQVNWNRGTVGASSRLPFGGEKRSGNGHPAALYSTLYCTYPVASLEEVSPSVPPSRLPGMG